MTIYSLIYGVSCCTQRQDVKMSSISVQETEYESSEQVTKQKREDAEVELGSLLLFYFTCVCVSCVVLHIYFDLLLILLPYVGIVFILCMMWMLSYTFTVVHFPDQSNVFVLVIVLLCFVLPFLCCGFIIKALLALFRWKDTFLFWPWKCRNPINLVTTITECYLGRQSIIFDVDMYSPVLSRPLH